MSRTTTLSESEHQHLLPHESGWAIKRTGAKRASKTFEKKSDAMVEAVKAAQRNKTVLVVHGKDGRVQEQRDYSG